MWIQYNIQKKTNCKLVHLPWLKSCTKIWRTYTHKTELKLRPSTIAMNPCVHVQIFIVVIYFFSLSFCSHWKSSSYFCAMLCCFSFVLLCSIHLVRVLGRFTQWNSQTYCYIIFWMKIFYIIPRRHVISKQDQTIQQMQ